MRWFLIFALVWGLSAQAEPVNKAGDKLTFTPVKVQVARIQIKDEVSFEDAVESLKLRANQHNLKFVGSSPLYKEIEALTGKPAKRMEIFSFCDGLVAQQMITAEPTMIAFMPCRIALLEDERGARWIISMMIDKKTILSMPAEIRIKAQRVMDAMKDIMLAASKGDL